VSAAGVLLVIASCSRQQACPVATSIAHAPTCSKLMLSFVFIMNCAQGCQPAPRKRNHPMPTCRKPRSGGPSVDELRNQGWKVAPRIYHHPLEWSHLADPDQFLENSVIYDPLVWSWYGTSLLHHHTMIQSQSYHTHPMPSSQPTFQTVPCKCQHM
jgi:hypothetical protein